MHQTVFGRRAGAQTHWGSLQHSPDPIAEFWGEERERNGRGGEEREGRVEKGKEWGYSFLKNGSLYSPLSGTLSTTHSPTLSMFGFNL